MSCRVAQPAVTSGAADKLARVSAVEHAVVEGTIQVLDHATREELASVYANAYAAYERLVEMGVARELARAVMPVGAYTEFYWTVNARALMNFVSLRAAETAQREIRRYADAVELLFAERMPITYEAFVAAGRVA